MDEKRRKILWIIIIILVIVGILLLVWILTTTNQTPPADDVFTTDNQPKFEIVSPPLTEPAEISPADDTEFTVANLAKTYASRFGSWSTDNQGQNLQDLLALSSARMKSQLQDIELNYDVNEFSGVTTKALSSDLLFLDEVDGDATVMVQAQRIETKNDFSQNIYYQKAQVELIKSGNNWLVDDFTWQE